MSVKAPDIQALSKQIPVEITRAVTSIREFFRKITTEGGVVTASDFALNGVSTAKSYTAGPIACGANTWTTIQSTNVQTMGKPLVLMFSAIFKDDTYPDADVSFRVLRDGTEIVPSNHGVRHRSVFSFMFHDTPLAGSHLYALQVSPLTSGITASSISMLLI